MTGWVLLGRMADVDGNGRWIAGWAGAIPVLVRNFQGDLRGFRNVCSHRFARMLTEPAGKGPLRCPYHAWVYDADGVPRAIPFNDTDFHLDEAGRRALALPPIAVTATHGLVFVHADPSADAGIPLGWMAAGRTHLPDGAVIGTNGVILHRPSAGREGAC
ncbi:Rieske 2Fe-2S domain-containing protein [Niveispirillum fermenti]|uniref:Rieske 2Fe-2S domain-containing protein n=1 Tax=Niveispirillum fermenti TaxID=1233113 RepID=UPI003A87F619